MAGVGLSEHGSIFAARAGRKPRWHFATFAPDAEVTPALKAPRQFIGRGHARCAVPGRSVCCMASTGMDESRDTGGEPILPKGLPQNKVLDIWLDEDLHLPMMKERKAKVPGTLPQTQEQSDERARRLFVANEAIGYGGICSCERYGAEVIGKGGSACDRGRRHRLWPLEAGALGRKKTTETDPRCLT